MSVMSVILHPTLLFLPCTFPLFFTVTVEERKWRDIRGRCKITDITDTTDGRRHYTARPLRRGQNTRMHGADAPVDRASNPRRYLAAENERDRSTPIGTRVEVRAAFL